MLGTARILITAAAILLLAGCIVHVEDDDHAPDWRVRQTNNRALIQQLEIGASIDEIYQQLGPADVTEAFVDGDREYRILSYRTQHRRSDGDTTPDETTPLLFVNGRLVGWGQVAVERTLRDRGF